MSTAKAFFAGSRARGLGLVLIVAVPLLMVTTYSYAAARNEARLAAQDRALNLALLAQHEYQIRINAALELVMPGFPYFPRTDAFSEILANTEACNRSLARVLAASTGYLNLFEADLQGNVICSAVSLTGPVSSAGRDYFVESISTLQPAIGELTVGRLTNKPTTVVGHPILDRNGNAAGVAAASVDLSQIVSLANTPGLPTGSTVTMLNSRGIVMARNIEPEQWIGKPATSVVGLGITSAAGNGDISVGIGVDGVERL